MSRRRRRSRGLRGLGQEAMVTAAAPEAPHSLLLGLPIGVGACYLAAKYTTPLTDEQIMQLHRPVKPALIGAAVGALMLFSKKWRKAGVGTLLGAAAYYGYQVSQTPPPAPPFYTLMPQ
jgi:hypothetical protein